MSTVSRILASTVFFFIACAGARAQATQWCLPSDDLAESLLGYAEALGTDPDTLFAQERQDTGVQLTTIENVERVTVDAVCEVAAQHYATAVQAASGAVPVHVFRVGDFYLVVDPTTKTGDRINIAYFDNSWTWLGTVAT